MTVDDMERWHKNLAQAAAILSTALARRRRPKTMVQDILVQLEPIIKEMKDDIK